VTELWVFFRIGEFIAIAITGLFWLKAQRYRSVAESKDEVIKLLTSAADGWKARYEAEHLEYKNHRTTTHDERNNANAQILTLTEENTNLKAKTDLSPVRAFIEEQNIFNEKFLRALNAIVERLEKGSGGSPKPGNKKKTSVAL
jgi:hypothetical protein